MYIIIFIIIIIFNYLFSKYSKKIKIKKLINLYLDSLKELKNTQRKVTEYQTIFNNISFHASNLLIKLIILLLPFIIIYIIFLTATDLNKYLSMLISTTVFIPIKYK